MYGEAVRNRDQLVIELLEEIGGDRGSRLGSALTLDALRFLGPLAGLDGLLDGGEALIGSLRVGFGGARVHHAFARELRGVFLPHRGRRLDPFVHHRLRVRGLVGLVVAVASVAYEVDHHVGMEFLAVHQGEPHRRQARFGIVGIDVDDRDIKALGEIAGVVGRAGFPRLSGETDLVIQNQMNRAAGCVALQPRQVERLGDDALSRERRVAVQQDGQRGVPVVLRLRSLPIGLIGARPPFDDRIDRLEMAGIR